MFIIYDYECDYEYDYEYITRMFTSVSLVIFTNTALLH